MKPRSLRHASNPFVAAAVSLLLCLGFVSHTESAALRRPISNTSPLFTFKCYQTTGTAVEALYNVIPADLRPYSAIMFGEMADEATMKSELESVLTKADQLGVFVIWCTGSQDVYPSFCTSLLKGLFTHRSFLGIWYVETATPTGTCSTYPFRLIGEQLSIVAQNGGILYWQDYSFSSYCNNPTKTNIFPWTTFPKEFVDSMRLYKDNVVLDDKHNTYGGENFSSTGSIFGYWLSGLAGAWGCHTEDWDWQSNAVPGFGRFGSDPTPFDSPLAGFGTDFLRDMPHGCCVYSAESPGNVYPYPGSSIRMNPPAWKMVQYPLLQRMIRDTLIPTKEEVIAQVKAAVHVSVANAPQLAQDAIYKGLYGPEHSPSYEFWPSTGRYGLIPLLTPFSTQTEFAKFPEVVHTASLPWSSEAEKVSWFNTRYPLAAGSSGTAWFYNVRNKWFITNPEETGTLNATFKFNLKGNPALALGGNFSGGYNSKFAFAIVKELQGALSIYVNNYFLDATETGQVLTSENQYIRKNTFTISGLSSEPAMTLTAVKGYNDDNNFSYTKAWDAAGKVFTITLNHNGPVDITVNHTDFAGPAPTGVTVRPVSTASGALMQGRLAMIDGRVVMNGIMDMRRISRVADARGRVFVVYAQEGGSPHRQSARLVFSHGR